MSAPTPDLLRTARTSRLLREITGPDSPAPHRGRRAREGISWSVLVPSLFVITFVE
jgi:hypothetical protein